MYQVPQLNSSTGWTYGDTSGDPGFASGIVTWPSSGTAAVQPAQWAVHMQTDYMTVSCILGTMTSQGSGVYLRGNSGFTNRVSVQATSSGIYIWTYSSGSDNGTNRASKTSGVSPASGNILTLTCVGTLYTAYLNGVSEVTWTDSGNTQTIGASNRLCGVVGINGSSHSGPINTVIFQDTNFSQFNNSLYVPMQRASLR
jgi:hypothetical protein